MNSAIAVTCAFFPVYLAVRMAFARLPLHIDSGFYVSNSTIATRRLRFSRGWNARFAGCSKVVPELFYGLIYLFHDRDKRCTSSVRWGYKHWSRFYASLFNYVTAIAVGTLVFVLSDGNWQLYACALIVYALLSSEPHWGGYFECGELFENLASVLALLFLLIGLERGELPWFVYAAFVWTLSTFFVKLSSAVGFTILFGGCAFLYPTTIPALVAGAGASTLLYLGWIAANGKNPLALIRSLVGHESSYNQWHDWRGSLHRLGEKARCFANAAWRNPIIPALAVTGAIFAVSTEPVFWFYVAAVAVTFVAQATDCRYYLLPLTPPIAVLAAGGIVIVMSLGPAGLLNVAGLLAIWMIAVPVRAMCYATPRLNDWCWKGGVTEIQAAGNLLLDTAAETLRELCHKESLLVYGPLNQACVLTGASWPTPIVAPEYYMDHVYPGWQRELNAQLIASPPRWILDTGHCFSAKTARTKLGLDYRCDHRFGRSLRLYQLSEVTSPATGAHNALTYAVQTSADMFVEEARAGDRFTVHDFDNEFHPDCERTGDLAETALAELLGDLAQRGYKKLAVYGAGRFTLRHADLYRKSGVPVSLVLDDNGELDGKTCADWPIKALEKVTPADFDAVIISTDRFAKAMLARIRRKLGRDVPTFTINF